MSVTKSRKKKTDGYSIDEQKYFVHFLDEGGSVVILNYDEQSTKYFRLTDFAADVVDCIISKRGCQAGDIVDRLLPKYDSTKGKLQIELQKVLENLEQHSIV